ncbi:MAG TPA: TPM domain-containing protein [Candidatus Kapabacteria bacterium]|nr:TPM domain-containing protein [Candidatus Kapabacteria bacterium]
MHRQILLVLAFVASLAASAFADLAVPKLTTRVYDETGTLSTDQKQSLEAKLAYYEDSTSTQIVVVIVNTLGGADVSDYAIQTGNQNHVGQSKKNNGIVILLAKNDHQGFIATGYGMEPTVTDAVASVIFRDILRPALRQNDYYGGISAAIDSIAAASRGEFKGTGTVVVQPRRNERGNGFIFVIVIFILIAIVRAAIGTGLRRTVVGAQGAHHGFMSGFLSALFWSNIFRGGGGSGSSFGGFGGGSGFSGGGFGGFSGGGGSFGGGGAGGSW